MKYLICFLSLLLILGCDPVEKPPEYIPEGDIYDDHIDVGTTKKDDSTVCAYWRCSTTKKLYMQKYVKNSGNYFQPSSYRPDGAYKLDKGEGAFPLEELDKYSHDEGKVSWSVGFDPCPYCSNSGVGQCSCKKVFCVEGNQGICPWCGIECHFTPGDVSVGGGG
jgi:hypothetical protein